MQREFFARRADCVAIAFTSRRYETQMAYAVYRLYILCTSHYLRERSRESHTYTHGALTE